ncbi:MAG: hydrogenase maturation protease [Chloroflexota bacterium]|nr:MAG: hydrogenase maturation protease [Chloroflexota bacterium]
MKTLVLGLGNPILCDDGVGIRVAHEVGNQLNNPHVTVAETSAAGFSLLDSIVGYDKVIIIDAIQTQKGQAGQIYHMEPEDFSLTKHLSSPHQINLVTALELGEMLNLTMPREISIFAVEAKDITSFSEKCTPEVEQVIPEAVKMVMDELVG